MPVEPIETAHFIWAILGAKAGADAAVINLVVDSFFIVVRCEHWADRLTGGIVAVLAQHGKEDESLPELRVLVALDLEPGHLSALNDTLLPDHPQVVFGIAGGSAG